MENKVGNVLKRKIISGSLTSIMLSLILGLIEPFVFGEKINSSREYFGDFISAMPTYLLYSLPIIIIYGSITSYFSDWIAKRIAKNKQKKFEVFYSAIFHIIFGLVLLWYSLLASVLFFAIDLFLKRRNKVYKLMEVFIFLVLPILIFFIMMIILRF